jgi:hypothetical protein
MRKRSDAFNGRGAIRFGRQSLSHIADHNVRAAVFIPAFQLASKPREIPTNATTAPMPIAMPTIVKAGAHRAPHQPAGGRR